MKSVRVLVLGSRDSTLIHVLRTLAKSTKYDYTLFGYGSENDFIQKSFNTKLLKNPSTETELIPFLIDSCEKNEIDFIIPTSTEFVAPLCENLEDFRTKNVEPIVPLSDPSLLEIIFHRPTLFDYARNVLSISTPDYGIIKDKSTIHETTQSLGHPEKPVLFSPSHTSQSSNIRFVDGSLDSEKLFFDEKPDAVITTLQQFSDSLSDEFPEITALGFDCRTEYSVEVLCRKGLTFAIMIYPSNPLSNNLQSSAVLTKDQHFIEIEKLAKRVVEGFGFSYSVGMRVWIDPDGTARLVDIIPHLRDDVVFCYHGGVNFPEFIADMAFQEFDYDYEPSIKWGLQMQRVWLELLDYQGEVWNTEM